MTSSPQEENLIDFGEPPPPKPWLGPSRRRSNSPQNLKVNGSAKGIKPSPSPPPKPQALRSPSPNPPEGQDSAFKPPPPRPRKPSSAVKPSAPLNHPPLPTDGARSVTPSPGEKPSPASQPPLQTQITPVAHTLQPSPLSQVTQHSPTDLMRRPPLPNRPKTLQKITGAVGNVLHGSQSNVTSHARPTSSAGPANLELPRPMSSQSATRSMDNLRSPTDPVRTAGVAPPPLPPPRRNVTASSIAPFTTATGRPGNRLSGNSYDDESLPGFPGEAGMSKKEYLWQQRLVKAKQQLEPRGVTVRTWRVGSDVADVCVKLVELELRRIEKEERDALERDVKERRGGVSGRY
jgi:hypothetical protein